MRNGQNKRMRGRNRSHKGHHGGGGGGHHNPLTRVYESNGPDVKIRGTAHHIAEKYLQLARDAQSAGDPVTAENHFQHAEHYFRLIAAAQEQFRQQNPYYQAPPPPGQNTGDEAFEGEEEDGPQPAVAQGQPYQGQLAQPQPGYGGQPNYQPREQPQAFGAPQPNYQPRTQHQPPYNPGQPSQYQQPQVEASDGERLPSFITGAPQPQAGSQGSTQQGSTQQGFTQQGFAANGHDGGNSQDGQRFPRHRRRRHRGGPRPDVAAAAAQDVGSDGPEAGNS